jgi:rod shape determining protein RodA
MNPFRQLLVLRRMNYTMVVFVLLLAITGLMFIYSASGHATDRPVIEWTQQAGFFLIGLGAYFTVAAVDYRRICRESRLIYAVAVTLLLLVFIAGIERNDSRRWLWFGFPGLGLAFQPAEPAKLGTILLLAWILSRPRARMGNVMFLGLNLLVVLLPFVAIVLQPDLGTAMVFLPVAFAMMFVAGIDHKLLIGAVLAGVILVSVVLGMLFLPEKLGCSEETQDRVMSFTGIKEYQKARLASFVSPDEDPLKRGYNKMQSEIAIGSGKVMGKGFGKGTSNILGFLPRTVAPTDFIFSVVAEEKGFVGSVSMVLLFAVLLTCGIRSAAVARDKLGRLLAVGITTMIFVHAFVNIAMTIGLMPIVGLPLPLVSSGGTFMVSSLLGLGLVQSVYIRRRFVRY